MSDAYWLTIDDEGTTLVDDAAALEAGVGVARMCSPAVPEALGHRPRCRGH
jgi:hypothetical protein